MQEQTIFDLMYPKYKINKPIRLIELFGGYGSQYLSLKYLGTNVEHWKLVEWASKSIQAYNDIHIQDYNDYSKFLTDDEVLDKITKLGVSLNYNEPATREQLKRQDYRKIYNNIVATNDLVNIQQVKGKDLDIKDTDKYDYIMTYSFPCQDLSNAGLKKGMSDTSTRSGLLWEVERILTELDEKPQILLMENVPQVHDKNNKNDFKKWILRLEELGYKNYFQDLIATDYGIPQTRNRCFMVSILGDYSYTFPKPIRLKLKLKDMLEDEVDEKYYISDGILNNIMSENQAGYLSGGKWDKINESARRYYKEDGNAPTIHTCSGGNTEPKIAIKNATKKGYIEATDGDGIDLTMPNSETRRGRVQKNSIQTLTTQNNLGVCIGTYQYAKSDNFMQGKDRLQLGKEVSDTLQTTQKEGIVNSDLRIRKLTPRECFRLMGVKDEDFDKVRKNQSDSSLYHLAGDSIVVNILCEIFKQLLQ